MLARDDEADSFQRFESMANRHRKSIKTFSKQGCVQDIFNFYIKDDILSLKNDFLDVFYKQTCRFKINLSFGFILRNRTDGNFRYWRASNGVDRTLNHPLLISIFSDFETFLNKVFDQDMLEKARLSRPNSFWVVEVVSNITFFINKLKEHPIVCGINLPNFIVNNAGLHALQKNRNTSKLYSDNLCVFRSLALHTGCTLQNLESKTKELCLCYCKFATVDPSNFQGVTLHDLVQIANCFSLSVNVCALEWKEQAVAEILQRSRHLFSCNIFDVLTTSFFSWEYL